MESVKSVTYPSTVDLGAARQYLSALAGACEEGATSPDPRITLLAMAVVARAAGELPQVSTEAILSEVRILGHGPTLRWLAWRRWLASGRRAPSV